MPSTSPAVPNTRPDWIASTVFLPITDGGASRSTRVRRAARCNRGPRDDLEARRDHASQELALVGDDVEVRAGAEVDDDRGTAEAREGGQRVDDPVGADLARVVREDETPVLVPGPDDQRLEREVAAGHLAELLR